MSESSLVLLAYQCAPDEGSVARIGWEWWRRLRERHAVTLVTHSRHRTSLHTQSRGADIRYIDTEWLAGPLYRACKTLLPGREHAVFTLASLDYFAFDLAAFRALRRGLSAGEGWRLIHRVTPVSISAPSWCARLGLPFLMGPLNCGLGQPPGFGSLMREESGWTSALRAGPALLDRLIGSSHRVSRFLVANETSWLAVPARHRERARAMLENAVDETRFHAQPWPPAPGDGTPLEVLFVGRLIPVKGLPMLIEAVAMLAAQGHSVHLTVVGDGPQAAHCKALAARLLGGRVSFKGACSRDEVAQHMAHSHVLCLPSVRESGGAVLLEAMACARPVIALDFGGPASLVTADVGACIPLTSPRQVTADLATTLADIFHAPEAWRERGLTASRCVAREHGWAARIIAAEQHYRELIEGEAP